MIVALATVVELLEFLRYIRAGAKGTAGTAIAVPVLTVKKWRNITNKSSNSDKFKTNGKNNNNSIVFLQLVECV